MHYYALNNTYQYKIFQLFAVIFKIINLIIKLNRYVHKKILFRDQYWMFSCRKIMRCYEEISQQMKQVTVLNII